MRFVCVGLGLVLAVINAGMALAQAPSPVIATQNTSGTNVPTVSIYCTDSSGLAQICNFSGGGGGGGAVTQSGIWQVNLGYGGSVVSSSNPLGTTDLALDALISGSRLKVDGSGVTQPVSGTFWQATQPVSIASMPSTPVTGTFYQATQPVSIAANVPTYLQAVSSGGVSMGSTNTLINAASSTISANLKASGGNVYGWIATNANSTSVYCRFFNLTVAPTVGTSTVYIPFIVPPTSNYAFSTDVGLSFGTGISVDCTAGSLAASDTTAITTANTVTLTVFYK